MAGEEELPDDNSQNVRLVPIQRLPEDVVNRIAAGEVIQRPCSALKELLENSLDAGSTSISVTVKEGGIRLLQVQDNGHGIRECDLGIVCERHTTSKLRKYEDLQGIATLGFRGEALASISFVAHLTLTTMLHGSEVVHALRARYEDGKLVGEEGRPGAAVPCAGVPGTTISVEDLFYNVLTRKRALKSPSEEYSRILDVVGRYAVFKTGVSFTCKKAGEGRLDLHSPACTSRVDAIRAVYGAQAAKHLLPLKVSLPHKDIGGCSSTPLNSGAESQGGDDDVAGEVSTSPEDVATFALDALVSSASYSAKKTTMILFINARLVECPPLKRACEAVYATLLPKADKPFIFMDLKMPDSHVDVNTHPTKKEVSFLHLEEVVTAIQQALEATLLNSNNARTFYTQTLLPGAEAPGVSEEPSQSTQPASGKGQGGSQRVKEYEHKLVRTDCSNPQGSLDAYLRGPSSQTPASTSLPPRPKSGPSGLKDSPGTTPHRTSGPSLQPIATTDSAAENDLSGVRAAAKRRRTQNQASGSKSVSPNHAASSPAQQLTSIQELVAEIEEKAHQELTLIFRQHVYVGMADDTLALVQHKRKLYLVQVQQLTKELVYQQALRRFGCFGSIRLSSPASVHELLLLAMDEEEEAGHWTPEDGPKEEIATLGAQLILEKAPMLHEYFQMQFSDSGELVSLPLILDQFTPDLSRLPSFTLALANEVNWEAEKECFQSMAEALADFYCVRSILDPPPDETARAEAGEAGVSGVCPCSWTMQHVLFPAMRLFLRPPAKFSTDGTIVQVACLEQLYKVFERC